MILPLRNSDWALPRPRGKTSGAANWKPQECKHWLISEALKTMNPNSVGKSNLPPVDSGHEQALKRLLDKDPNAENLSDDPEKAKLGIKKKRRPEISTRFDR